MGVAGNRKRLQRVGWENISH